MKRVHIDMLLLTETALTNGNPVGMHLDTGIQIDRLGVPVIPGRSLKGFFRRSLLDYLSVMQPDDLPDNIATLLFGCRAPADAYASGPGSLWTPSHFGNG